MMLNVRFFIFSDEECEIVECSEREFLDSPDPIEYERNTIQENGVSQICLTKMPKG